MNILMEQIYELPMEMSLRPVKSYNLLLKILFTSKLHKKIVIIINNTNYKEFSFHKKHLHTWFYFL